MVRFFLKKGTLEKLKKEKFSVYKDSFSIERKNYPRTVFTKVLFNKIIVLSLYKDILQENCL